jgi:hypothetical protein
MKLYLKGEINNMEYYTKRNVKFEVTDAHQDGTISKRNLLEVNDVGDTISDMLLVFVELMMGQTYDIELIKRYVNYSEDTHEVYPIRDGE